MAVVAQTKFTHKLFEPTLTINEAKTHCVAIFDKLKFQREQGRFCDVILKVYDRDFPAHRCVLASCSPWFDTKLKVHKTLKEVIEIENCKNYEVFHLVLTYMYSGEVVINKDNVADILAISHMYSINKLKSYCAEFLDKNLKVSNCINSIELAEKYHLADFSKQTLAYINKNFDNIFQYYEVDKKTATEMEHFIGKSWGIPNQLVLRLITRWVDYQPEREEHFPNLLNSLNWSSIDPAFIDNHLDNEKLYKNSEDALFAILIVMEKNNVELSPKYRAISQEKLLCSSALPQELADSSEFLFMKDFDNTEMYEHISSFMQNMQNDSIGNEASYVGPYRHPSGNDMELFKAENLNNSSNDTSQQHQQLQQQQQHQHQQQQGKKTIKRSASCSREDEECIGVTASDVTEDDGANIGPIAADDSSGSTSKYDQDKSRAPSKSNLDQNCALMPDPRLYMNDVRSGVDGSDGGGGTSQPVSNITMPDISSNSGVTGQLTSPPNGQANLTSHDVDIKSTVNLNQPPLTPYTSNQDSCNNMFKNFPTPTSAQNQELVGVSGVGVGLHQHSGEPCYRQAQYQGGGASSSGGTKGPPLLQYSNHELRFHAMVDHVDGGELFKQHDMYRDDLRVVGGASSYPQLGFLPPNGAPDQMLFQDHQVFSRDSVNTNRDICGPHANYMENYKHLNAEGQSMMLEGARGIGDDYSGNYGKQSSEHSRQPAMVPSSEAHKPDRIERMNSNRSNFDLDYQHLFEIIQDKPPGGAGTTNIDPVMNDQRLNDRSATTTKRYDPKFRALAEASKQVEPEQALFGYKGPDADVGDHMATDFKSHYMYKMGQPESAGVNYRPHATVTNYKQQDFLIEKNEMECYRYGSDMGRDCANYKQSSDINSYNKDTGARSQVTNMPRSVESEMFKGAGRPMMTNEYLSCNGMAKDSGMSFESMNQDPYPPPDGVAGGNTNDVGNEKVARTAQQMAVCGAAGTGVADGEGGNNMHHSHNTSVSHSSTQQQQHQHLAKRLDSGQKLGDAWAKGAQELDVGEQNLQQEFKNCRISERAPERSEGHALPTVDSVNNLYDNVSTRHCASNERQWLEQTRKSSWDNNSKMAVANNHKHERLANVNRCQVDQSNVNAESTDEFINESHKMVIIDRTEYESVMSRGVDDQKMQRKGRHAMPKESGQLLDPMQLDCQFVEDMRPISYDPIPVSSCTTPHYSRDSGSIIEPFRNSEILEPSLLEFQDMNSLATDIKKSILETPPRKELDSPTKRKQKTVPPPMILTPKEKYAKEIHAERKLESIMKNVFNDNSFDAADTVNKLKSNAIERSSNGNDLQTVSLHPGYFVKKDPENEHADFDDTCTEIDATQNHANRDPLDGIDVNQHLSNSQYNEDITDPKRTQDFKEEIIKENIASQQPIKIQNNILKILKTKKKLASQKRLFVEQGGVKLTHKQKVKLKQKKKKPSAVPENPATVAVTQTEEPKDSNTVLKVDYTAKKIVNLKDKLLAEHRSQSILVSTIEKFDASSVDDQVDLQKSSQIQVQQLQQQVFPKQKQPTDHCEAVRQTHPKEPFLVGSQDHNLMDQHLVVRAAVDDNLMKGTASFIKESCSKAAEVKTINVQEITVQPLLSCIYCEAVINERKAYYKHIKDEHGRQGPYKCPKCEQEYSKISVLLKHHKTHRCKHECTTCHAVFITNPELRNHMKIHRSVTQHVCGVCQKTFSTKNNLEQHKAVHSDEKKFKCNQCAYSTKFSSHLAEHKRTHEGKVHRCTIEGCPYWTPKRTLLNAHMRMHNGEKKFVCKVCAKGFVEAGQLRRHERIHNDEKKFVCDVEGCSYSSNRKDKLKEHKGRIHNREPTPPPPDKKRPSKLSSLNKYYISSVQSDISEAVEEEEEDDVEGGESGGGGHATAAGEGDAAAFDEGVSHQQRSVGAAQPQGGQGQDSVNRYYSVEGGVQLSESQIPYVKEEFILGI